MKIKLLVYVFIPQVVDTWPNLLELFESVTWDLFFEPLISKLRRVALWHRHGRAKTRDLFVYLLACLLEAT